MIKKKSSAPARSAGATQQATQINQSALQVLLALADGDKHGWAILKDVERFTDGRILLSAGTLYGLIKRLFTLDLIEESPDRPPVHWDDQRRRYYRLTNAGRSAAGDEIARLEKLVAVAHARKIRPSRARS